MIRSSNLLSQLTTKELFWWADQRVQFQDPVGLIHYVTMECVLICEVFEVREIHLFVPID